MGDIDGKGEETEDRYPQAYKYTIIIQRLS